MACSQIGRQGGNSLIGRTRPELVLWKASKSLGATQYSQLQNSCLSYFIELEGEERRILMRTIHMVKDEHFLFWGRGLGYFPKARPHSYLYRTDSLPSLRVSFQFRGIVWVSFWSKCWELQCPILYQERRNNANNERGKHPTYIIRGCASLALCFGALLIHFGGGDSGKLIDDQQEVGAIP